jgi:uncharacterized membrane protein YkoI
MIAVGVSVTAASETRIAWKDLPEPVRAAAHTMTAGGAVKHVEMEKAEGQVVYAVEASMGGTDKEFTFSADGTLLAEEEDVALADVPEAVRATAEEYFGGRSRLSASKEIAGGVTSYEVEGRKGGREVSLRLSETGSVLGNEVEDGEDDD